MPYIRRLAWEYVPRDRHHYSQILSRTNKDSHVHEFKFVFEFSSSVRGVYEGNSSSVTKKKMYKSLRKFIVCNCCLSRKVILGHIVLHVE